MYRPASATKLAESKLDQYAEAQNTTSPNHDRLKHLCNKLAGLNQNIEEQKMSKKETMESSI